MKEQLSRQGFSGPLTGKVHLDELGSLHCGIRVYRVFFWDWEESNPPGEAIHAAYRLIFFDGEKYLGSYKVGDRPNTLTAESILFPYPEKFGNRIACADIGPGRNADLNGEQVAFFK